MKPRIIDKCSKHYKFDYEKVVLKILDKIPDKFLSGISEIIFENKGPDSYGVKYYFDKSRSSLSKIYINMDIHIYTGNSFMIYFYLNTGFLVNITKHISLYLKPVSNDKDILNYKIPNANYIWAYFGPWTPIFELLRILFLPIAKFK